MARGARGKSAISFKVEGLKELDAALGELSKATARNVILKSLQSAAKPFVEHAKRLVAVDTGQLKDAITSGGKIVGAGKAEYAGVMKAGGTKKQAAAALRDARRKAGGSTYEIYAGVSRMAYYAHFVEFGTVKVPPRPFIRPAFDAEKNNMLDILKNDLKQNIDKAVARRAARIARKAKG